MTQAVLSALALLDNARCLECDYPLRGLATSDHCPECGRSFDPADAWTMNVSRPHGKFIAALLKPVGLPTIVAAAGATLAVFWWTAALPLAAQAMEIGLLLWLAVYLYRILRYAARRICARVYRYPLRSKPRRIFMLLIVLTGLMIWTRFPLRAIFWLSKPAMDRVAVYYYEKVPLTSPPPPPRFIGIFPVQYLYLSPSGIFIQIDDGTGLCYEPDAGSPYSDHNRWGHLGGNWYIERHTESEILAQPVWYMQFTIYRFTSLWL